MPRQRPRGFTDGYKPRTNAALLETVQSVLIEYSAQLPVTCRQIFYRLVGEHNYEKTEQAYDRLLEMLNLARRGGVIPFDAIRDDGPAVISPDLFSSADNWIRNAQAWARSFRLDPWTDQPCYIEVICEAGGMVPMLAAVADPYGITVRSGGGFDSVTAKHDLAKHYASLDRHVTVLHIGDFDPSGEALWINLSEDVTAFCTALGGSVQVVRIAVTLDQQREYSLPTAPPKKKDKRGCFNSDITVQAEALPPDLLQSLLRHEIEQRMDLDALAATKAEEEDLALDLSARLSLI